MDWFRRNWPDVLIGIALILVIAGIVSTLITGGSPFPFGSGNRPAAPVQTPPPFDAPRDDATEVPSLAPPSDPIPSPTVEPLPLDAGDAPGDALAQPSVPEEIESVEPDPTAAGTQSETPPEPSAPSTPASQPAGEAPAVTPSNNPTDPFRVSVGAFSSPENAERQADRFREAGYPVFLANQGDITLVLVGPYASEAEARTVRDAIDASEPDVQPIIYLYSEDDDADASPVPDDSPATPAVDAPAEAPTTPDVEGTRLQVGAFADRNAAEPAIERLEDIGFRVDVVSEDGLLKLVVGPFAADALESARSLLNQAGFEHFPR